MSREDELFDATARVLTAAWHNTELAETAIAKMEKETEKLRRIIQQEIKEYLENSIDSTVTNLVKKFQLADTYAEKAAKRYKDAAHFAIWKVSAIAVVIGLATILGTSFLFERTVVSLRKEKEQLEYTIADLAKRGGKIQLRECTDKQRTRLCAKINEQTPKYEDGFRILAGY